MVQVAVAVTVADDNDPSPQCRIASIRSNEPVNGRGDGNTAPDWSITGDLTALRAERAGGGSGRRYTLDVECIDAAGNSSPSSATVAVPKSRGKR